VFYIFLPIAANGGIEEGTSGSEVVNAGAWQKPLAHEVDECVDTVIGPLSGKTDDEMGLDEKRRWFKVCQKAREMGRESPFLDVMYVLGSIDEREIETPESRVIHVIQGFFIEVSRVEAVHGRQDYACAFKAFKDAVEKGDIEVQHVIFEINCFYAEFDALPYLFLNVRPRPPPVGYRWFPAKSALKGTAPRCEQKGIGPPADTIVSAANELSVWDEIDIPLCGYIGNVKPDAVFE
jgi:hypothetical protein